MSALVDVGASGDLADGTMKGVKAEGHDLLLARVGDAFYAADDHCPHMGSRLSHGTLEGTIVVCPRHGSRFDLSDGSVVRWTDRSGVMLTLAKIFKTPIPLKTYRVESREDRLFVGIE
jgi:3-phenylpropionate/trans-cinnamate dioxygenase ferredoxin component